MLIDRLRQKDLKIGNFSIQDAIIFKINEDGSSFASNSILSNKFNQLSDMYLPSRLPYSNIAICFNDTVIWCCERNDQEYYWGSLLIGDNRFLLIESVAFSARVPLESICDDNNEIIKSCLFRIDKENLQMNNWGYLLNGVMNDPTREPKIHQLIGVRLSIIYRFLMFLSCKNIRLQKEYPPKKIQKKREKNCRPLLVSYYTLKLQNIIYRNTEDKNRSGLWSNRIHLCRGHMKEYTPEKPLFGKYAGRFWIKPHVRGNNKKGFIVKDYEF